MSIEMDKLNSRIAALEAKLSGKVAEDKAEEKDDDKADKQASERSKLSAEITALERKLGVASDDDADADDKDDEKLASDDKDDEKDDEKKASEVDPSGVEEDITQKRFTEVEDLEHGTELTTEPTTLDAAPTEFIARLKSASARLDTVASYLEKTGRKAMAERIDMIADAIDQRIATATVRK